MSGPIGSRVLPLTSAHTTPVNAPPNHTKNRKKSSLSTLHKMINKSDIQLILTDLESQEAYIY